MDSLPESLIPGNDAARLEALGRYQPLNNRSEQVLDDVVALTARLFRVSTAMISMVEHSTVLVKAPYNLPGPVDRVPRQQSLCSATILGNETAVFEDVDKASPPDIDLTLFRQMGLHFYAGHSLHTPDGYNVGTLCLADTLPRQFSLSERGLLAKLAGLVMRLLELRRVLGPHAGLTAPLWAIVYRAIGEQLTHLSSLAERIVQAVPSGPLPPAISAKAEDIVGSVDQLLAATLRRS